MDNAHLRTPEQEAYAAKQKFSDELPRQRQVWRVEYVRAVEASERLTHICDGGGLIFQVLTSGSGFDVIWYAFED